MVGGELTLALDSDKERRAASSGGQLARKVNALEQKRERTLELSNHQLDKVLERESIALSLVLVVQELDQLDHHFGVGLRLEFVAFANLKDE